MTRGIARPAGRGGRWPSILTVASLASSTSLAGQSAPLAGFDRYVEQAMAVWKVPGLAVAVVADERVALSRGYGVREIGREVRCAALQV